MWKSRPHIGLLVRHLKEFHRKNEHLVTITLNHNPIDGKWKLTTDQFVTGKNYGKELIPPSNIKFDHNGAARRILGDVLENQRS